MSSASVRRFRKVVALVCIVFLSIVLPFGILLPGALHKDTGEAINASVAIATMVALLAALFPDAINSFLRPLSALLTVVRKEGLYEPIVGDFVWHLRVKNTSGPERPLNNCTVALTGIARSDEGWDDLPVERAFRWAPAESRDLGVTLSSERIVDFGRINSAERAEKEYDDRFFLTLYKYFDQESGNYIPQGGYLPAWVMPNETVRFRVEIRAQDFAQSYVIRVFWDGGRSEVAKEMAKHLIVEDPIAL